MNGINSVSSIFLSRDISALGSAKPAAVDQNVSPSTVVSLGYHSPKIGTGIDAYRSIQRLDSEVTNTDLANLLISLMLMQFIMELL